MSINILVVDDEKELADVIELYLTNDGYTVHKFYTGAEALDCIAHTDLDLAILDVMLPDADGFQICKKIREKSYYPIIILTAKVADGDKIMGLTIGADDYITKPFNPLEVVARVKTQLRRYMQYNNLISKQEEPAHEYDIRGLIINKDNHKCPLSFLFSGISVNTKGLSFPPKNFLRRYGARNFYRITIRSWPTSDVCGRKWTSQPEIQNLSKRYGE